MAIPRYTVVEDDGSTHGVLFINSNAQEFETFPLPGLVYRTIGDLAAPWRQVAWWTCWCSLGPARRTWSGSTPLQSAGSSGHKTRSIYRFDVPPYWALGYHLCR